MIAMFRAELVKLTRPRVLAAAGSTTAVFAIAAATGVLLAADAGGGPSSQGRFPTIETLGGAGGATEAFAVGASFAGLLLFLAFTANIAAEHDRSTFRTLLLKQPKRFSLLAGKMLALLAFAAVMLLTAEVLSVGVSVMLAPSQNIITGNWFTSAGFAEAAVDFGTALFMTVVWGIYGMTLANVVRSLPLVVAIGVAWAGPLEHLIGQAWSPGTRWFPGLLLEAVAAGGNIDVAIRPALTTSVLYAAGVGVVGVLAFTQRDIPT